VTEKKESVQRYSGLLRKRYMALEGRCFSLYQPSLNLSEEEYNRRLEEIKKWGNMG
jgi:hypothetical protein